MGVNAYVVGGYVRDALIDRDCYDIDVLSVGKGIDFAQQVAAKLGDRKINIYRNFGTAQVVHEEYDIEFVGARKESYHRESRNPIVENDTLDHDLSRRDFTSQCPCRILKQKDIRKCY